jgi:hypothetical protein
VSRATASFCAAVGADGNALTYNSGTWSGASHIDGVNYLPSVSCATASFCVAVDDSGNALTYSTSSPPPSCTRLQITTVSLPAGTINAA